MASGKKYTIEEKAYLQRRIEYLRKHAGLSFQQIKKELQISYNTLHDLKRGIK